MNPIFFALVKSGKVIFNDVKSFNDYTQTLEGKEVEVIVRTPKKPRSKPQNNFMWGVCYKIISDHTGYTLDEVHDAMRMMFLRDENRKIPTLKSTTSLSTVEMSLYWEQMQQFAAENLGLVIPDPEKIEL